MRSCSIFLCVTSLYQFFTITSSNHVDGDGRTACFQAKKYLTVDIYSIVAICSSVYCISAAPVSRLLWTTLWMSLQDVSIPFIWPYIQKRVVNLIVFLILDLGESTQTSCSICTHSIAMPISPPGFNKNSFTPMTHRAQRFPIYSNQEHLLSKSTLIPPESQKMTWGTEFCVLFCFSQSTNTSYWTVYTENPGKGTKTLSNRMLPI